MLKPRLTARWDSQKKKWQLTAIMYVQSKRFGIIEVAAGFFTDLATIHYLPIPYLAMILSGYGVEAAVVHDWLYHTGQLTRKQSDYVYYEVLRQTGTARWRALIFYAGARAFGWYFWKH